MALYIRVNNVADGEKLCFDKDEHGNDRMHPTTQTIGFTMLPCLLGEITDKNWKEVAYRFKMYERLSGHKICILQGNGEGKGHTEIPITWKDIKAHIGLTVNSRTETRAAFHKHMLKITEQDINWKFSKEEGWNG